MSENIMAEIVGKTVRPWTILFVPAVWRIAAAIAPATQLLLGGVIVAEYGVESLLQTIESGYIFYVILGTARRYRSHRLVRSWPCASSAFR